MQVRLEMVIKMASVRVFRYFINSYYSLTAFMPWTGKQENLCV